MDLSRAVAQGQSSPVDLREQWVGAEGRRIRCLVAGEGKPLLLCHGFLSSAEEFGGRFSALAAHRRLIIPDLPGSGQSPPLRGRHTVDALATSLEDVLDELDVDEFDVAGLCLGAAVATTLALRCGSRVGRLVLHTPLVDPALIRRRHRHQIRILTLPAVWQAVVALSRNRTVSDLYKRFVIVEGDVDRETAEVNFANQRRANATAAREWLLDGMRRADLGALLARTLPTLVIVPAHDQVVDVDGLRRLISARSNVTLFIDEQQGHGWNSAAVQRQLGVMLEFFARDDSTGTRLAESA
ncbi:MAG: alpha/beta fold hydrolase [Candidatus Dormibacteria bacterium]